MLEPDINENQIPGYIGVNKVTKKPAAELFDPEFHVAVADYSGIGSFDSWMADCYDAIIQYYKAIAHDEKKKAAIRIGKTAWEAAESSVSIGNFLSAVADNWHYGVRGKRESFDWMRMRWDNNVSNAYVAKTLRHFIEADRATTQDDQLKHLAALFCNANILWRRCDDLYL